MGPDLPIVQEAFFLPTVAGDRFCVWREPANGAPRGIVVHVPAFAEEMNKARHVVAANARSLATQGYAVVQIDPLGCGDSPGDFGDASWDAWIDDVVASVRAASERVRGDRPLWLWGLRAGALLAAAALPRLGRNASMLLWQPVLSGKQHLTQFLRLALTAGVLADETDRAGTKALLARLAQEETVEVAGYRIAPALASGLASTDFTLSPEFDGRIAWLDIGARGADPALNPAAQACVTALQQRGIAVAVKRVDGPGFWQSAELEDCPEVIDASFAALEHQQ